MQQIEQRACDSIKQIFVEANKYLDAYLKGEQAKIKQNLIVFTNNSNINVNVFQAEEKGEIMPGITLRKDGRYMIRKMVDGERATFYTKSYNEALKILKKLKKDNSLIKPKENVKSPKLCDWIIEWENTYKRNFIKEKSLNDIHNSLKPIIQKLGKIELKELTTTQIQNCLNTLPKNRTKERTELYFNALLEKAYNLDLINKNPFKAVQKIKKGKYKNDAFKFEEQEKIISITKNTDIECEILIYLLTGARPAEFPNFENIDLKNKIIKINGTKNDKSLHREVEISENFANYLQEHFKNHKLKKYEFIRKKFKTICDKANINKPILYRLRHTFASNHFVLGTQTKQVSDWMGHSSVKITLDTYTDIDKTATKQKILELYNNFYYIKE